MVTPASAEPACADSYAKIVAALHETFGEYETVKMIEGRQSLRVTIFVSPQGSWTQTVTYPDGRTCLLASGDNFQMAVVR